MFKEDKEKYFIFVFIYKDKVIIFIDIIGDVLYKRGYREKVNKVLIREILVVGFIYLIFWKVGRVLVDFMCGFGIILIEVVMIGINMVFGLNREFILEKWRIFDKKIWWDVRKDVFNKIDNEFKFKIYGYDIDEEFIDIVRENVEIVGVDEYIEFNVGDVI